MSGRLGVLKQYEFRNIGKTCECCGQSLILNNTRDIVRKRFCSRSCTAKATLTNLGHKHSDETKQKMRARKLELVAQGWRPSGWRFCPARLRVSQHHGYKFIGCQREHKLLMEEKLGRKLVIGEVVHHINGDKLDNSLDNLMAMSRSEHSRLHYPEKELVICLQ